MVVVTPASGTEDNAQGMEPARGHPSWPLAVIAAGALLSVLWCFGLLYGAYLLSLWLLT
jgi:hypothetical protein